MYVLKLTRQQQEQVRVKSDGAGGFQGLARELQLALKGDTLTLGSSLARRVIKYTDPKYGSGGFQGRIAFLRQPLQKLMPADGQTGLGL